jgi:hypothetical protein
MSATRERAVALGADANLIGILCEPSLPHSTPAAAGRPFVIFLNAGVIHRVGPHRLHVNLARRLAERGLASLRLDLSGIGDSRSVPGSLSFRASAVADARAAMDHLAAELGASSFVLFGLCSGADNALATAEADPRVAGIVVLDPPAYITPYARARGFAGRLRTMRDARTILTRGVAAVARRVRARLGEASVHADDDPEITGGREVPPPAVFRAQLGALVARRVAILAVFSGALGIRYNHADQLFELFPELRGKLDRAYYPHANHVFTELAEQRALIDTVLDWFERRA